MIHIHILYYLAGHGSNSSDLFRHGAVLGLAEIVLALSENGVLSFLPNNIEELLTELVPTLERKRLYRGRGGEIMRSAVCRLMKCISMSRIPLSVKGQVRLLDSIESNIPHPTEVIQEDACLTTTTGSTDKVRAYMKLRFRIHQL